MLLFLDDIAVDIFWSVLIDRCPRTLDAFLSNSLTRGALIRLQQFYTLLPPTADIPNNIIEAHRNLTQSIKAIANIETFINNAAFLPVVDSQGDDEDMEAFSGFATKKKQGERKKQAKAVKGHLRSTSQTKLRVGLDPVLFDTLGCDMPKSKEEAERTGSALVKGLVKIMTARSDLYSIKGLANPFRV